MHTQEAMWLTAAVHDDIVRAYEAEEHQLLQEATPVLKRFLAGVKAWLGGSNEWHRHSGRYQN